MFNQEYKYLHYVIGGIEVKCNHNIAVSYISVYSLVKSFLKVIV